MSKKTIAIDPFQKPRNKEQFQNCLKSRMWRLHNLYTIKDKEAKLVKFVPNQEQLHLLRTMHTRNIILKVRQLGISTFWLIYMLDSALFYPGVETGCIAHTREDAQELFENKVKLAYDHLPEEIRKMHTQTSDSARKLAFSNGSSIRIGTSFRSGTPVIVLVSEFGRLSAEAPEQAREIKTGTFNAVPENGILVVESTAKGRQGLFYELVQDARRKATEGTRLSPYDWKFYFFDWVNTPQYSLDPSFVQVSDELTEYFDRMEHEIGTTIPPEKRAWYAAKSGNKLSDDMKQEFPTTPDEAFEQTIEGAIFKREMNETRNEHRILDTRPNPAYLVDTVWDIGYRDATAIIWFQCIPPDRVIILNYYENNFETLAHYAKKLQEIREKFGIVYGQHFGPHDIEKHDYSTGFTIDDYARDLGITFTCIPRASAKQDLIETARRVFPRCWFDRKRASGLINCLDNYRYEKKPNMDAYSDKPRRDWSAHGADAFQYLAYAVENFGGSSAVMTKQKASELYEQYAPPVL